MTTKAPPELLEAPYRKNLVINGNFDWWQRGTSHSTLYYGSADRFGHEYAGSSTSTLSQQTFTLGQTDVPNNPAHYARFTCTAGATTSSYTVGYHKIEDVASVADGPMTVSFWAKADAAKPFTMEITQSFGTGGTPSARVLLTSQKVNLTTSWAKYELTFDMPSISGKTLGTTDYTSHINIYFWFNAGSNFNVRTDTLGLQDGTFDFAQIQAEKGNIATDFELRKPEDELSLCQRYFETGWAHWIGHNAAANVFGGTFISYNTRKRVSTPTITYGTPSENVNLYSLSTTPRVNGFRVWSTTVAAGNFYYSGSYTSDAEL